MTDITVHRAHWAPVSAGEYDRRTRRISVNLTIVEEVTRRFGHDADRVVAAIVAHERVHALSTPDTLPHEEERQAREAAIAAAGATLVMHIDEVLAGAWT